MVTLGDFAYDNYFKHEYTPFAWLLFIMATAFTQITMLNMLIAIMGDTFDKVTENRRTFTMRTKLQILGDYTGNFPEKETNDLFLFSVTIDQDEQEDGYDTWEGLVQRLRRFNTRQFAQLNQKINDQMDEIKTLIQDVSMRDQA